MTTYGKLVYEPSNAMALALKRAKLTPMRKRWPRFKPSKPKYERLEVVVAARS